MRLLGRFSQHVNRASILVLAGFLVGFALSGLVSEGLLRTQILNCGVAGFIAVVGLHFVAQRHRQEAAARATEDEAARALQVVRCLNSMRQSLQDKVREIEGQPTGFRRAEGRRTSPAGREAQTP